MELFIDRGETRDLGRETLFALKPMFIGIILLLIPLNLSAQSLGTGLQVGYTIANHPRFPELKSPSLGTSLEWYAKENNQQYWSILQKYPSLQLTTTMQTLGNQEVLGNAFGLMPIMGYYLLRKEKLSLQAQMGWGLSYLTRSYDSFRNPANIVIGTRLNAYTTARLRLGYWLGNWEPNLSLAVAHYSNANFRAPNLGANIPLLQLGLRYRYGERVERDLQAEQALLDELPALKRRWSPLVQIGLGSSAIVPRGPQFPVYVLALGANWRYGRGAALRAGFEYSYNAAARRFVEHAAGQQLPSSDFGRYVFWLGHELHFGRIGFHSMGGIFLNQHREQRSWIATDLGLNFYPRSVFKQPTHQFWVGLHIRAYFGLAEFPMLQVGYRF